MKRLLALAALALAPLSLQAQSAADWNAINLAVTDTHVVPSYARLDTAAASLVPAAAALCATPGQEQLNVLRAAFHDAMDAWQGVQHLQFGPVTYFNWNYRLQFWPDDNGTGARQLDALLAAADSSVLEPASFERQSVGVQGFPALERLLFDDTALDTLGTTPYACTLVQAIAANLAGIGRGVHLRWQDEFRSTIANAEASSQFESAQDATVDFYKSLVESVRRYQQQKLESVLGETQAQARPRRAESWRSQRSLRNLKVNVAALQDLYALGEPALASALLPEDVVTVTAAFDALQQTLAPLPDDFAPLLADADGYAQLQQLRERLDALFEALEAAVKNTDLYLGFNSLDGD